MAEFFFKWLINPLMKLLLKSPLHGLASKNTMLITFVGRRSGKRYTTPVGYIWDGDTVICFTQSPWWKNLRGGPEVSLRIQGRNRRGISEVVSKDVPRIAEGIHKFLVAVPSWASFYQVTMEEDGTPNPQDVARAAESAILIEIRVQEP